MYLNYNDFAKEIDNVISECAKIAAQESYKLKYINNGWLKPHKKLVTFSNHLKVNFNLPRSRAREKKQIFILKAAA